MKLAEYESIKKMDKELECDKCHYVWTLSDTMFQSENVKNEKGQEMNVHFFLCPQCNKIYVVEIIDMKVSMYKEKIVRLEKRISRLQKYGKPCGEEVSKRNLLKQNLVCYEVALKNKYNKFFYLRT